MKSSGSDDFLGDPKGLRGDSVLYANICAAVILSHLVGTISLTARRASAFRSEPAGDRQPKVGHKLLLRRLRLAPQPLDGGGELGLQAEAEGEG